jgi:2-oxo-3-hexenedioate decarboxylase
MDWEDAYDIQWAIRRRKEARGTKMAGLKMGLTSYAKMSQMGVDTPIYAFLADYFSVPDGGSIKADELIHPKIEAEVAVVTNKEIRGPGCTIAHVMAATECVMPAVEIIDSRYENFNFDLKSVIADNASSSRFVTGGIMQKLEGLDLKSLGVVIEINGEIAGMGAGAAVLGHPLSAVAMLANMLAERDEEIPAGTFVMTGGITAAFAIKAGDSVCVRYQDLGSINFTVE